ncbi:MAG: 4Fe-4S binding protein [Candidatus Moranbacteria bacterium]|nr:4Fe-4S binding protein [Candidatus Moranbacteria bacterium]
MKYKIKLRTFSQITAVGIVLFLTLSHLKFGIEQAAPIDAYCPFGAIEGFLTYLFTGEYLKRIYASSFILMGILLVSTLIFGRVFCSHFCPLGAIQEWMRSVGRKIGIKNDVELPVKMDAVLRYAKYVILAVIIYFSYQVGDLVFRAYDPFNALMHFGEEFDEKVFGYSILGLLVLASLFSKNWWCRYFCPLGATFAIFKKVSPFKISRNASTCVSCGTCTQSCPAGLPVEKQDETKSGDCISCLDCVSECPESSLKAQVFGWEISKAKFSLIVIGAFFLPLLIFMATPLWQVKAPSNIVNTAGEVDLTNLRGSNTLQYLIDTTGIPLSVFQEKLHLPVDVDTKLKLKDIGPKYNLKNSEGVFIEAEEFREVVEQLK